MNSDFWLCERGSVAFAVARFNARKRFCFAPDGMYRNAYNRLSEPDPEPDGGSQAFENRETSGADVHRAENRQGKNCYDTCGSLENTFGPAQEKR